MIKIVVVLDDSGCLYRMSLSGHAGFALNGADPACAAVTLLARTVARLIASRTGWTVDGKAPEPGNLFLVVNQRPEDTDEWLQGVTDTLLLALADIDEEFPGAIAVSLEEKNNGS
ncbi:MAG: ribosomal-processing cysteine protease Prp [Spirochaetaceae bacterium]|nr:ribosomal-processing cysteine protease Prp [Spirochaetaceae bacterium]